MAYLKDCMFVSKIMYLVLKLDQGYFKYSLKFAERVSEIFFLNAKLLYPDGVLWTQDAWISLQTLRTVLIKMTSY